MANWVLNELRIEGNKQQIKAFKQAIQDDEIGIGSVDFNKIKKMPEEIEGTRQALDWSREYWGTKWNANNDSAVLDEDTNLLLFETAWTGVPGLVMKMAFMFPDLSIEYLYADEDLGSNIGHFTFTENGVQNVLAQEGVREHSEMAIKFAAELWGYSDDMILDALNE